MILPSRHSGQAQREPESSPLAATSRRRSSVSRSAGHRSDSPLGGRTDDSSRCSKTETGFVVWPVWAGDV
jgi:hypothetical protein